MSWHYSRAGASVSSVHSCADGGRLSPSSPTSSLDPFSFADRTTESSIHSQFGTESKRSTVALGAGESTSSRPDFLVRHFQRQAGAARSPSIIGANSFELSRRSSLNGSSLRTSSAMRFRSLLGRTFKTRVRPRLELRSGETVIGWLPTVTTRHNQDSPSMAEKWPAYRRLARVANGGGASLALLEWMIGIPIGWTVNESLEMDRFREWFDCFGNYHDRNDGGRCFGKYHDRNGG